MKKINKKVERYIELSIKFQKSAEDVFGKEPINHSFITLGSGNHQIQYTSTQEQPKEKSRAEKIREKAKIDAKQAEDYDEYIALQKEYYKALNTINK